ncbi:hypothetical protein M422DRAFT_25386 [Sphaerobolus stellatus SS14]|nr:hypothetical protein M422DRAFT_25386 [Sphaerobolus stellatus SS14]
MAAAAGLPAYTTQDIPSYTAHPQGGEQTLGQSRLRRNPDTANLRDFTVKLGTAATLSLSEQPAGVELPIYGRRTDVKGHLTLHSTEDITKVALRLHGYVKCKTIAEYGEANIIVLDAPTILWEGTNGSSCPNILPFEIPLASTYAGSNGQSEAMPPSFEYIFYDVQGGTPGLKFKVKYEIQLEIEHGHNSIKDKLTSTHLGTPFIYHPRTRPATRPSRVPSSLFESVMDRRVGKSKDEDPIVWKLRLPPPGTYSLTQTIPFRVSVTSRSSSQITPFAPSNKRERAIIRVYVLRQVSIKVNNVDLWRSYIIGEGQLKYVPTIDGIWLKNVTRPKKGSNDSLASSSELEGWAAHEWEGEVKTDKEISVGGFKIGDMSVKDFIVLSVIPPNPHSGHLLEVKRVIPIQLTTDEYDPGYAVPPPVALSDSSSDRGGYLEGRGDGHHIQSPPATYGHTPGNQINSNAA